MANTSPAIEDHKAQPVPGIAHLSFEQALEELEGIVRSLEDGRATLAQAIASYERGAALRRHCEDKLKEAEAKVQAVVDGPGGLSLRDVE